MRTLLLAIVAVLASAAPAAAARPAANSGAPGSACKAAYLPAADDVAFDTTSLGELAPAPYEIGGPVSGEVRRVMIFIHGGGWYQVGPGTLDVAHPVVDGWRHADWETVNLDYRACRNSIRDVVKHYDLVRAQVGPDVPICVQGASAGGQLALMLAAHRPDVACVMAYAAPTDLRTIAAQGGAGAYIRGLARAAFGADRLARVSPVALASRIRSRLLLATASDDTKVPVAQVGALADAVRATAPYLDIDVLEPGKTGFVHGTASAAAMKTLNADVEQLVAPYGHAPTTAKPAPPPFLPWSLRRR